MSKKVFIIFNDAIDKRQQAFWFVNNFIKEEYRDPGYLISISQRLLQNEYGMSCDKESDRWVWMSCPSYTKGMTQVFYPTKNMGEI